MSQINSLDDVRQVLANYDDYARQYKECPVEKRRLERLDAERECARKDHEARAQQKQAANGWDSWLAAIDARIAQHLQCNFGQEDGPYILGIRNALGEIQAMLRKEFQTAIDSLRGELNATASKLHDEINTRFSRLPLESKTWEPVREALDQIRQQRHEQARSELQAAVATLRGEFNAATSELHNEINTRLAQLPVVKAWDADEISYCGDVVTHDGSVWQARRDTGKEPPHQDWILLARAGRDGDTPRFRGAFNAHEEYRRFDIAEFDGSSFIALYDDPGIPGDEKWQLLAGRGGKGPAGATGPRGRKGEHGSRGADAPTIVAWTLDPTHYRAVPTMSNGKQGAVLELRGLFEQYHSEVGGGS